MTIPSERAMRASSNLERRVPYMTWTDTLRERVAALFDAFARSASAGEEAVAEVAAIIHDRTHREVCAIDYAALEPAQRTPYLDTARAVLEHLAAHGGAKA